MSLTSLQVFACSISVITQKQTKTVQQAAQQGAAPDRLQPTLDPRSGFRRRVS
jgi:hypothetical protein